ncbi:heparinase II/III family protein [uncultured Serinicoccus sp.]|uniref:heparinase II/III domain-containing protein n=1 Tax=uncultured Serinicoccus sp. TaxID=735514 RepID=UPI0026298FE1|nr:heparinase II/III family protein [uncultured Serinicoccus sp.]
MLSSPPGALSSVRELEHVVIIKQGVEARRRFADWRSRKHLKSDAHGDIAYQDGGCWEDSSLERSAQRYLHGFLFLSDWYAVIESGDDSDALDDACEMAMEWDRRFGDRYPGPNQADSVAAGVPAMAYHDDATARRLIQLSHLMDVAGSRMTSEHHDALSSLLQRTALLLATDEFYAGLNNHGLFQDLAVAKYLADGDRTIDPETRAQLSETVVRRLEQNLFSAFTPDGVHVENSPGYHFIVALLLVVGVPVLEALGSPRAGELREVLDATERFATHVLRPDGTLPPLGDTKPVRWSEASLTRTYRGEDFRWSVTQGRRGTTPGERHAVFPHAGYLVYRSSWADRGAEYCLLKAGYHSHYHHAADDIALLISSRRVPVIAEAGHYGYDLTDPMVRYAYSQYAHNSVVVGGRSQPRVSGKTGGVEFEHLSATGPGEVVRVRGTNRRSSGWTWSRVLTVVEPGNDRPGEGDYDGPVTYVVEDSVDLHGPAEEDFEVRWHLAPGMRLEDMPGGVRLMAKERHIADIEWQCDLGLAVGTESGILEPEPRGWVFREPGKKWPSTVLVLSGRGPRLRLVTTIRTRREATA